MSVVTVRHQLISASQEPVVGRTVTGELVTTSPWLADGTASIVTSDTATSGNDGWFELKLVPQVELGAVGSHYRIRIAESWTTYHCVVPASTDPVQLGDILVDPDTLDPLPPEVASLYLARAELGLPGGPVPLGQDGKISATYLPAGSGGGAVDSVNGQTGDVVLDAADVGAPPTSRQINVGAGLSGGGTLATNVTINLGSATQASLAKADTATQPGQLATVATSGAYADLTGKPAIPDSYDDLTGTVPTSALPALAVTEYLGAVANQAAMLALAGQKGDWCTRLDLGTNWIITGDDPTQLASWTALSYPAAPVASVNGQVGVVTLAKGDVGLGNVANLAPADLGISTAAQAALDGKVNLALVDAAGDLLVGSGPDALTRLAKGADGKVLGVVAGTLAWIDPPAGGRVRVASEYIISGNINPIPNTSGGWRYPGEANGLPADFELEVPAAIGDWVEVDIDAMKDGTTSGFLDAAIKMGSGPYTYPWHASSGGSSPTVEGMPGWYRHDYAMRSAARGLYVTSAHVQGGVVRFVVAVKGAGSGQMFASAAYPFWWAARNLGPPPA